MFVFYDLEVFTHDWLVVFEQEGEITRIHNDSEAFKSFLSSVQNNKQILVGYNNYNYDDRVAAAILKSMDPYDVSQKIIQNKRFGLRLQNPMTLDVMQELQSVSLKEAQANMSQSIIETPIDFNLERQLNQREIERVFQYCENDVLTTKELFKEREDYFTTKFEVVQEFKLPATALKKTRAGMAGDILKTKKGLDKERLNLTYGKNLSLNEIPDPVLNFYKDIQARFKQKENFKELEKEKFTYKLAGLEHVYGFGGLHAAKENYVAEGHFMQIDVSAYYPTLIINNAFLSLRSIEEYKRIYTTRKELKDADDDKQEAYKLIQNIVYGGMKSPWSNLYNPQMANNIVVNGQLTLTHLIVLLENFCELVQTNTDGIIIKYEPKMKDSILKLVKLFEHHYKLDFTIHYINKIAQRDVNNYVIRYEDGKLNAVGRFKNYDGGDFSRNSLTIIDKALVEYYINGIKPNKTVISEWKINRLDLFQNVVKAGKYDGMAHESFESTLFEGSYTSSFTSLQKVNRVFATSDKTLGGIYKTKNGAETRYTKVPYTSENCIVWNGDLFELNKRKINLNWYIKEIERWMF